MENNGEVEFSGDTVMNRSNVITLSALNISFFCLALLRNASANHVRVFDWVNLFILMLQQGFNSFEKMLPYCSEYLKKPTSKLDVFRIVL